MGIRDIMDMEKLQQVWEEVENWERCGDCPLKHKNKKPLLFKPGCQVSVMVITEGPNRVADEEDIASLANHPTYTFLSALFGGKFVPSGKNATVYWTHVRKCFISHNGKPLAKEDKVKESLGKCSSYLKSEIKTGPNFVLAVGGQAKSSLDIEGNLRDVFENQKSTRITKKIGEKSVKIRVVPHPSGLNPFWADPPEKTKEVLNLIRKEIINTVREPPA